MNNLPREHQYIPDKKKFNWNRLLSEPFSDQFVLGDIHTLSAVQGKIIRFPDVSYYQGRINFDLLSEKAQGVILRAHQGSWIDPKFKENYTEASKRKMKRGIYSFYDDRVDPKRHFETLKGLLDGHGLPEMEVFVDWENTYNGTHNKLKDVVAFMQLIEGEYPGVEVGMYTGFWWFIEHSNPITNFWQYKYLEQKPLWLASYTNDLTQVRIPAPWSLKRKLRHWQYGTPAIGPEMGVESEEIDMNIFIEVDHSWEDLYGKDLSQEEEGDKMTEWKRVSTRDGLRIRAGAGTSHRQIGSLEWGDIVEVDNNPISGWRRIYQHWRGDQKLTLPDPKDSCYCSDAYLASATAPQGSTPTEPTDPAPEPEPTPEPVPNSKTVTGITIENPQSVTIKYSDGTEQTFP
jgi:GH25 family lysozyme M1 (1,4-beta-N-acetylmuramidase)